MKNAICLLTVLLIALLLGTAAASTPEPVSASGAAQRLEDLLELADRGLYFTFNGDPCKVPYVKSHSCDNCNSSRVIKSGSAFRSESGLTLWPSVTRFFPKISSTKVRVYCCNGSSCVGFAGYAGWYIAAQKSTDNVVYRRVIDCRFSDVRTYAQPGDIITVGENPGHAMIYVDSDESNVYVLDCNNIPVAGSSRGNCLIQRITYSMKKHGSKAVTLSRAVNVSSVTPYHRIASDELNGHTYVLYNGYSSWEEARDFVLSLGEGWNLATITSPEEQAVVSGLAEEWNNLYHGGNCWIGAEYSGGAWKWVTGEPFAYSNFRTSSSGSSDAPYGCIYGITFSASASRYDAINAVSGKWDGLSRLHAGTQSGFIAEYDPLQTKTPRFLGYSRRAYRTGPDGADGLTAPDPNADGLLCINENTTFFSESLYRGTDGKLWVTYEGAFIPAAELTEIQSFRTTEYVPHSVPTGLMQHDETYVLDFSLNSSDTLLGCRVSIHDRTTGKVVQEAEYVGADLTRTTLVSGDTDLNRRICIGRLPSGEYRIVIEPIYGAGELNGNTAAFRDESYTSDFTMDSDESVLEYSVQYASGLHLRAEPGKTSASLGVMPAGSHFWVMQNTAVKNSADGYIWARCCTAGNLWGWAAISDKSFCAPVEYGVWDEMITLRYESGSEIIKTGDVISAVCLDASLDTMEWESSDPDVLTVSSFGGCGENCTITAVGAGTATITVSDKYQRTFEVISADTITLGDFVIAPNHYTSAADDYMIKSYSGSDSTAVFPAMIGDYRITAVESSGLFDDASIATLVLDEGIEKIHAGAFEYAFLSVRHIYLPSTLTSIGASAFVFDSDVFCDVHFSGDTSLDYGAIENLRHESDAYGTSFRITFHCASQSAAAEYAETRGWEIVQTDDAAEDTETTYDNGKGAYYFAQQCDPVSYAPNSALADRMADVMNRYPMGAWFTTDGKPYDGSNYPKINPITGASYSGNRLWDMRYAYVVFHSLFGTNLNGSGTALMHRYADYNLPSSVTGTSLYDFFTQAGAGYGTHFRNNNVISLIVLDYDDSAVWALNCTSSGAPHGAMRIGAVCFTWEELAALLDPTVNLYIERPDTQITLDRTEITLGLGETADLKASLTSYNNLDAIFSWSSSRPEAGDVVHSWSGTESEYTAVEYGRVKAHGVHPGTMTITVQTLFGFTAECTVTVERPSVIIEEEQITLLYNPYQLGSACVLHASVLPETANQTAAVWYSTDENIVSVSDGFIVAKGPGTATVGLIHPTLQRDTCEVTVVEQTKIIAFPDGITEIGPEALAGAAAVELVMLPDSLASIPPRLFAGCRQKLYVCIPDAVSEIADDAFADCPDITAIVASGSPAEAYCRSKGIRMIVEE